METEKHGKCPDPDSNAPRDEITCKWQPLTLIYIYIYIYIFPNPWTPKSNKHEYFWILYGSWRPVTMWKSFLGMVRFILTKYEPICIHGDPIHITCCSKIAPIWQYYKIFLLNMFSNGANNVRPLELRPKGKSNFRWSSPTSCFCKKAFSYGFLQRFSRFVKGTPFLILRPSWNYFTETLFQTGTPSNSLYPGISDLSIWVKGSQVCSLWCLREVDKYPDISRKHWVRW